MSHDYFAILQLAPGRYEPAELQHRFEQLRSAAIEALDRNGDGAAARARLEDLHLAFQMLRDPSRQAELLDGLRPEREPVSYMRRLAEASLEGGLLRHSRREHLMAEARRLGVSEFHAHLIIAQVQFGQWRVSIDPPRSRRTREAGRSADPLAIRLAATGVLALALFFGAVRWFSL